MALSYQELKREVVQLPERHARNLLSKTLVGSITDGMNIWLKIDKEKIEFIHEITNLVYKGMTGIDDILDNDSRRRGFPTIHLIYGPALTTTSSIITLMNACKLATKLHPEAVNIVLEELSNMYEGTSMDIYWRDMHKCPSKEMYLGMVTDKAAKFVSLPSRLMQLFSENKYDFTNFINNMGVYGQLANDFLSLADVNYNNLKGDLTDIAEGKYSFPIIDALEKEGIDSKLEYILSQRTKNEELQAYALNIIKKHKSLDEVIKKMKEIRKNAEEEMANLGGNPTFEEYFRCRMEEMTAYM